jgi:cytochrome c peroxidase
MRGEIKFADTAIPLMIVIATAATGGTVSAQMVPDPFLPETLQSPLISQVEKSMPDPAQLALYVRDRAAALKLGKALFWDMQVGSDGSTACATCHFHAGADSRSKNQVSPGVLATVKDITFSGQLGSAPNRALTRDDFPLHKLADPNVRGSAVVSDTNDVVSSQGVHYGIFVAANTGQPVDVIQPAPDPDGFQIGAVNVRRVEPRNTPTVINAVFNKFLFWDGRAKDVFNGVNPSGTPNALVYKANGSGQLTAVSLQLGKSPLASLSVGPPLSMFEMSAAGRPFAEIGDKFLRDKLMKRKHRILAGEGRKLRGMRPLGKQVVHPQDNVLGTESRSPSPGLKTATYDALIKQAFRPEWWQSNRMIQVDADGNPTVLMGPADPSNGNQYELKEWNFQLFFGLALQEYMATLVDGDTPFDRFHRGDSGALSAQQINGLRLFFNAATADAASAANPGAGCNFCHTIPEFTAAAKRLADVDVVNQGFRNIGVRPVAEDPGRLDGTGPSTGRFKVPTLRNVELTAPYMHNGGMATLEQVVEFYSRGRSDFDAGQGGAAPGTVLNLSATQKADLVAFLKALTSELVRTEKAPFDHPQLFIPNGHPVNQTFVRANDKGNAKDDILVLPAVGRNGGPSIGPRNFLGIQ